MMEEQFKYCSISNDEIAREFDKTFESPESDMVVVKDIEIFSHCEHHIALMYNMKVTVGYMPKGRVIGLSKIARIADAVSRRFQIQERIGTDIRDIMKKVTGSDAVAVLIDGEHSCMTARGIKKLAPAPGRYPSPVLLRKTSNSARNSSCSQASNGHTGKGRLWIFSRNSPRAPSSSSPDAHRLRSSVTTPMPMK